MLDQIEGSKFLSKIIWKAEFHQIRMKPNHVDKMASNTKYTFFEYLHITKSASIAPVTVQTSLNQVFSNCMDEFALVYINDHFPFSKEKESHY